MEHSLNTDVAYATPTAKSGLASSAKSRAAARARERLEARFARGTDVVDATLDAVEASLPCDYLVPSQTLRMQPTDGGVEMVLADRDSAIGVHRHALGQLGNRAGIPKKYVDLLKAEDPRLLAHWA